MIDWNAVDKNVAKQRTKLNNEYANITAQRTPSLPKAPPRPLPRIPTAVQSRRGNLPQAKPINVLAEAFDKEENYIDKAKRGNLGGAAANFLGTGLTAAQTLYLNTANTVDSVAQGKGLPKYQPQMGFTDYDKSVAERRGALPTIEKVSKINPVLGGAYQFLGEVGTDPLELTPFGFANDIKMAKGLNQTSQAYQAALQGGKLTPTVILKSGKKVASKAEFDNLPPAEKTEVMSELERLAYESNVRKGKITPQNDTLYGNSFRPTMGELPAPRVQQGRTGAIVKPTQKASPYSKSFTDAIKTNGRPQSLYRGMELAELQDIANTGRIKSNGSYNFEYQQGLTLFSPDKQYATSYATGFAPTEIRNKFYNDGLPSYVVEVNNEPSLNMAVRKDSSNVDMSKTPISKSTGIEWSTLNEIPTSHIKSIEELKYNKATDGTMAKTYKGDEIKQLIKGYEPKETAFPQNKFVTDKNTGVDFFNVPNFDGSPSQYFVSSKNQGMIIDSLVEEQFEKDYFRDALGWTGEYAPKTSQAPKELPLLQPKSIYAAAKGQREVPRTITPNELPRANKVQPLPQASTKTVQPILPQKGAELPKEQPFVKNGDLPTKKIDNAPKTETYKKALYETAINEYDKTVASVEDYISKYKPKGVDIGIIPKNGDELMRDGGIRYAASKNDQWYQEYYKANGRKPSKAESREIAEKLVKESLKYGNGEFYNPDLGSLFNELKGLRSVGADTFKGEKTIDDSVNEFGAMRKGEMPRAREVDIPKKTDYGQTQRYARTLQESAIVDDTLFKDINEAITQGSFTKPTKGNKAAVDDASRTITDEGLDEAVSKFKSVLMSDKKPTSYDIALGNRTLQELQKVGRYDEALDVAIDLSEMLSESGRTLQAARIAKRLSPEGRLMIASRVASKVSKKTGKKVKLSDDTIKLISEAKTEKEVVEANQKAAIEIWNQAPPNWIDKVNSWRYMSMLFNPKTHMRNIVGNSIFVPVREFKNLIGAGLERALIKDGVRTKAVLNPVRDKAIMDFASNDFQNVKAILKNEGKLDDHVRNLDAKVFNFKPLEGVRRLNLNALDAEDTWFMKFAYDSSLAQYMKANKLTPDKMMGETLESARKYAMNESLKATYRDFNALATIISRGKHTLASGKYGPLGKAGGVALEGMIPFTKTPLNIVKRGVGYSPANLVRGIANLGRVKSGKVTATEAIDQLASGLSGTALLGLGTALGYNNIVSGKEGEYKDKLYNYNQMLGSQNYSLNIDGKSYTLDWAAPLSMPFFVGVEISKAIKDNNADLATVLDAMTQISDPMVNLSMLKGINDIMTNNFEGIGQTAFDIGTGYAGQFNPTVLGQISRTADPSRRSTISTAETGTLRGIEKFGRKQLAKIPFASKNLEPYIDLWGREQKNGNFVENFLSPGYFKSENVTKVDEELKSLVGKLDEETANKILPTSKAYQYTIQSAGLPYRMTEKESTAYQKTRGQESYKGLNKLFASIDYRKMSQEDKVKAVQDVYSDAHDKAKYDYFDSKGLPVTLALDKGYQEKYKTVKAYVSDKQFYSAVQSVKGKSTNIEKAYALAGKPDKVLEVFGIDTQAKEGYVPIMQKVDELRQSGIAANDYIKAKQAADMNASGNISKAEGQAYLDTRSDLTDQQKAAILQALVPALKAKNNPYY